MVHSPNARTQSYCLCVGVHVWVLLLLRLFLIHLKHKLARLLGALLRRSRPLASTHDTAVPRVLVRRSRLEPGTFSLKYSVRTTRLPPLVVVQVAVAVLLELLDFVANF